MRPGASSGEISRAVSRSLALVDGTSLGGYAMLDPEAAAVFREEIDEARRVLLDATLRAIYDTDHGYPPPREKNDERKATQAVPAASGHRESTPPASTSRDSISKGRTSSLPSLRILTPILTEEESTPLSQDPVLPTDMSEPVVALIEPPLAERAEDDTLVPAGASTIGEADAAETVAPVPVFDGKAVRSMRESRGVTLEALASETHIRRNFLVAIEEMAWAELPERVFVRGFLTQIARVLRVEAKSLVDGYLAHDPRSRGP